MISNSPRLKTYTEGVESVRVLLTSHQLGKKPEKGDLTLQLLQWCRSELPDSVLAWLDTVYVLSADERSFPPILGTGGNEGSQGYSSTFAQMLLLLGFDRKTGLSADSQELLHSALFGDPTTALKSAPAGVFDPGRAGGNNQGFGIGMSDFPTNPWNLILTLEGAILWSSSIGRKSAVDTRNLPKSPFTVKVRAVGYSSASKNEETDARAEIWTPLWKKPLGLKELLMFIQEGRSDIGRRRAGTTIEFAEAISSLGIDRGVTEFVRYDLLKRRGKSFIALPAGHFPVTYRREADLIRELDRILQKLDWFLSKEFPKNPPAGVVSARNRIDRAIYEVLLHGGASRIKYLLAAIGQMEQILIKLKKRPSLSRGLSPRWIVEADDGTLEIRIAAALASIRATGGVGVIRENLEHRDLNKPDQTAWAGNTFSRRLASVLARRMMDAKRVGCPSNPLDAVVSLVPEDIASFIEGDTDDRLVQDLLFGLMWIQWSDYAKTNEMVQKLRNPWIKPVNRRIIPRSWALLKLLFLPRAIRREGYEPILIKPEPSNVPLLIARRIDDGCEIARKRLFSSGFLPLNTRFPDTGNSERIAAALLIPVRQEKPLMSLVLEQNKTKQRG
jgi:CRISPR-associated protein Csx17